MDNINIVIDGKKIEAEKNKTILQIAAENNIAIPTLCHNEKISHTTSCFVCVVKDTKTGKFMPSCSAYPMNGAEYESSSEEVSEMRRSALNLLLSEHSGDCEAPCTIACPAHAAVEEYVRAGKNGDFLGALKIIKERIPLPMTIGRVCPRFCEKDCRKNVTGKPVAINEFKRLAADLFFDEYMEELPELNGKKVAIIGAGPAGLAAAYYLRLEGIESVIFDKMPKAGGMLRYGIPEYRLPKAILEREIEHFRKMGVKFEQNKELGKDITLDGLKKDYDAVAVSLGSWKPSLMRAEGEELAEQGIEWLGKIALKDWSGENPGKTIVIGGGNTAMDCLRTSVRLGSEDVTCFYRRTEKEMPAEDIEILEAKEEGVKFQFLTAPLKLRKEGEKLILTCQKMELGEPDASGRRRPMPIEGSEFDAEADTVIAAIGQATDAPDCLSTNKWGNINVCPDTGMMADNVFAAGDCVSGAATVVEGVTGGRKIALAISDFFADRKHEEPSQVLVSRGHWRSLAKDDLVFLKDVSNEERVPLEFIDMDKRTGTFDEVSITCSKEDLAEEGERCVECSCTAKSDCKLKKHSEEYGASTDAIKGEKALQGYDNRHPEIIHDRMKCIKCGTCVKICAEVVNQNLFSLKKRGFYTRVETAFGKVLPLECKDCGACIEECPVGALDWKNKK